MSAATRRLRAFSIGIVAFAILDQAIRLTALSDGRLLGRRIAPFDPPLFNAEQDASLERLRRVAAGEPQTGSIRYDGELGWVTPTLEVASDSWFDELGARRARTDGGVGGSTGGSRPLRDERPVEILLLGCSVTYGDEVRPDETWAHVLEVSLGARVANCGVSAYGIDQALLRLRRVGPSARPKEVWIGVLPKALLRLLSIYRPALRHHEPSVSFKPRFALDASGSLELVLNPARTPADAVALLSGDGAFFSAVGTKDAFVAHWPAAYSRLGAHPAHYCALSRIVLTQLENRSRPDVEVELAEPASELSRLATAVIVTAASEARSLGSRFRVVVFPDSDDLSRAATGRAPIAAWADRLRESGIEVIDAARSLLDAGARSDETWFRPGGHYAPRANEAIGAVLSSLAR